MSDTDTAPGTPAAVEPIPAANAPALAVPVPVWKCDFFPLKDPGAVALDSLTVGAKFGLKCHGDIAVAWDSATSFPRLVFPKPDLDDHSLAILKVVEQAPNDVQYEVTAYKAGDHKPTFVRFLQGTEHGFEVNQPAWTVKSVLDPKQPPQPVPPFGPWSLSLPLWFMVMLLAIVGLVIFLVARKARRYLQRRRMLEELKHHHTALPPINQFYRDARQLRRRLNNLKDPGDLKTIGADLNREFRLYVLRQFEIPALQWSDRAILEDLRRRHRKTYNLAAEPLKRTLRELSKLQTQSNVALHDVEQMHRMSLDAAERLESLRTGGGA